MQLAYLLVAHEDGVHFERLVRTLSAPHTHLLAHVNPRGTLQPPAWVPTIAGQPCSHGGFSVLQAVLRLLATALEQTDATYFIVLSGADYPIKPRAALDEFLARHVPANFINHYPLRDGALFTKNVRRYHFVDAAEFHPQWRPALEVAEGLLRLVPRAFVSGLEPYRGSCWCALHRDTVRLVIDFMGTPSGRSLLRHMRWCWGADEIFLQTAILNSAHASRCRGYGWSGSDEIAASLHYIDWDSQRENPALLDERDLDRLADSPAFFARKFNSARSEALLDAIDRQLLGLHEPVANALRP